MQDQNDKTLKEKPAAAFESEMIDIEELYLNSTITSRSFKNIVQTDNSFQDNSALEHSKNIQNASNSYLMKSFQQIQHLNLLSEINIKNIFGRNKTEFQFPQEQTLKNLIFKNPILKKIQKLQFLTDLKYQAMLIKLIFQLSQLFNQSTFYQITYVIYVAWTQYLKLKESLIIIPIIKSYQQSHDLSDESEKTQCLDFKDLTHQDWINEAKTASGLIFTEIYKMENIRILRLANYGVNILHPIVKQQLLNFLQIICSSVYLTVQGYFEVPKQSSINTFNIWQDDTIQEEFK